MPTPSRPLCAAYASRPDTVAEFGRINGANGVAQPIVAPANLPAYSVVRNSIGNYTITFFNTYVEFLGVQLTLEGSATGSALPEPQYTWNGTTYQLTITIVASGGGVQDANFCFIANFAENHMG